MTSENALVPFHEEGPRPEDGIAWLSTLPEGEGRFIQRCTDSVVSFSQGSYRNFFQNCGLYAVGSSLRGAHNDVDIVLVGLDFRAVIEYDKVFLMDPEALIAEKVVVPPYKFEILSEEGEEPMVLRPASHNTESIDSITFMGIEHGGVKYDYDLHRLAGDSLTMESFCAKRGKLSNLVTDLKDHVGKSMQAATTRLDDPFEQYFHEDSWFLVTRFGIFPLDPESSVSVPVPQEFKLPHPPIDFIFHAENLHPAAWKEHQRRYNLPFVALYEWPMANMNVEQRLTLTDLPQPEFIDPKGTERVKCNIYFPYLGDPPIFVEKKNPV
ncbi:hypothetical protein KY335_02330 [Candidatus Woesearchaeota archaeon]|nr:hypothetical protein [Candidatus Woesearchaeota archaeon]